MNRRTFRRLVNKVGGRYQAARIMDITKDTIVRAMAYGPAGDEGDGAPRGTLLSDAKLLELQRAAGVLEPPPHVAPGNGAGSSVFMKLVQLRAVQRYEIGLHPDGFQRPRNERRVAAIEAAIRAGKVKLGNLVFGRLPDGTLVEVDGGHRREALIRAEVDGHWVTIYAIADLEEARQLFLDFNMEAVRLKAEEAYRASRNPLSEVLRLYQENYKLVFRQVHGVVLGLLGSRGVDFNDLSCSLDSEDQARVEAILDGWTADPRWGRDDAPTFNDPRFLRALGHFARTYSPAVLVRAVELVRKSKPRWFQRHGRWTDLVEEPRELSESLAAYVNPHLMGGITKRKVVARAR